MTALALVIFLIGFTTGLLFLTGLSHKTQRLKNKIRNDDSLDETKRSVQLSWFEKFNEYIYTGIILLFLLITVLIYLYFSESSYKGHIQEWMNLLVRWMHITFGIAWIGTSFFFVFMENSLVKNQKRSELKGDMWMLHGGGFWFVEKYKVAPKKMPLGVHWFKYEAYFTWITGMALLAVVYYLNADAMLLKQDGPVSSPNAAIGISLVSLALGYLIYHLLSLTSLLKKPVQFGICLFIILIGFAWFYTEIFNARAAFIHFGALIGTLMAGNVFFVIIPAQKVFDSLPGCFP